MMVKAHSSCGPFWMKSQCCLVGAFLFLSCCHGFLIIKSPTTTIRRAPFLEKATSTRSFSTAATTPTTRLLVSFQKDEDEELIRVGRGGRSRRRRQFDDDDDDEEDYDIDDELYDDDDDDEDDWDDEDDYDDDEDYGLFSNVVIDNPLLDNIDPDGAAERFPELARDPRFWLDMFLFIGFLNWLSAVGPRDYFPDIPWSV